MAESLVLQKNGVLHYQKTTFKRVNSEYVLVKVVHSGICGSDISRGFNNKAYHYPLIMGHEFSGVVKEVPDGSNFSKGDRVVVFPLLPCYVCGPCRAGDYAQCENYDYYGSRRDGGFATYVEVPEANLFLVPDRVSLKSAAMTEPCAVALHGVKKLNITTGMTALVLGAGPVGNMTAQWLRLKGCSRVYISDIDDRKLEIAQSQGFIPIQAATYDVVEKLNELEPGGVSCVVEAVGIPKTFLQTIQCAARFGQIIFMGNIQGDFIVPESEFTNILRKELTIRGTWNSKIIPRGKDEWSEVLANLDHNIIVDPLISHVVPLSEGKTMFEKIVKHTEWSNKVLFVLEEE